MGYQTYYCIFKQPCLICSGTRDICTPVVAASLFENIPNSHWEVFKGARHTCFVEQTDKYFAVLEKWLKEVELGTVKFE